MSTGAGAPEVHDKLTSLKEEKVQGSPLAFHKVLVDQAPKAQGLSGLSKLLSKSRSTDNLQQQELTSPPPYNPIVSPHIVRHADPPREVARADTISDLPFSCKVWLPSRTKVIVHINEVTSLERLVRSVLEACATFAEARDLHELARQVMVAVADDEGKVDEDVPVLDPGQPVHEFGVHSFVFLAKPTNGTAALTLQSLSARLPTVYLGPKNKQHMVDPASRLFQAAETGNLDAVRRLLENDFVEINTTGIDNWTALHFSCRKGHLPIVTYLLKNSAQVNAPSKSGWTPLHLACDKGHIDTAEMLLMWGADPGIKALDGKTAKDCAGGTGNSELVELLASAEEDAAREREEANQRADNELMGEGHDNDQEHDEGTGDSRPTSPLEHSGSNSAMMSPVLVRRTSSGLDSPGGEVLARLEISGVSVALGTPSTPEHAA